MKTVYKKTLCFLLGTAALAGCQSFSGAPDTATPTAAQAVAELEQGATVYLKNCASCHGEDRMGRMGPALIPQNFERLSQEKAIQSISDGLPATQMQGFATTLSKEEIAAVTKYIFSDRHAKPEWPAEKINASKEEFATPAAPARKLKDRLNVFAVVELGDSAISFLDGSNWEVINRVKVHSNVHGGPKFSRDAKFMYFASRDGWVGKIDLSNFTLVSTLRVGINSRNVALSTDGKYLAIANYLPHNIVILDTATMTPEKVIPALSRDGKSSRVSAVYTAPQRKSFIAGLKDAAEFFEIPYDKGELIPKAVATEVFMDDFFFDQGYSKIINTSRNHPGKGFVFDIESGKTLKTFQFEGMPHLGSGITFKSGKKTLMAIPNMKESHLTILDTASWEVLKKIKTPGPGFFVRSHPHSKYIWHDSLLSPAQDTMTVIDKELLEVTKTLLPQKGKTAAHIEYDKTGRYALLSLRDKVSGELLVYDTTNFEVIRSIPMKIPSGKYNLFNKVNYAEGTSH